MEEWPEYALHEFDIRREGRRWSREEFARKWRPHPEVPEKLEYFDGKVFLSEGQRLTMLGWMLEQLGADVAVGLGHPKVWREAVEAAHGTGGVGAAGWMEGVPEPWASVLRTEILSRSRKARAILDAATGDEGELRAARDRIRGMGLDPDKVPNDPPDKEEPS